MKRQDNHVNHRKISDSRNRYATERDVDDHRRQTVNRSRSPIERHFRYSLGRDHKDMGPLNLRSQSPTREHDSDQNMSRGKRNPTSSTGFSVRCTAEYNSTDTTDNMKNKNRPIERSRSPTKCQDRDTPLRDNREERKAKRNCSQLEEDGYSSKAKENTRRIRDTSTRCPQELNFSDCLKDYGLKEEKRMPRDGSPKRHSREQNSCDTLEEWNLNQQPRKGRYNAPGNSQAIDFSVGEYNTRLEANKTSFGIKERDSFRDRYATMTDNKEEHVDEDIYLEDSADDHQQQNNDIQNGRCVPNEELKTKPSRRNCRDSSEQVPSPTEMRKPMGRKKAARTQSPISSSNRQHSSKLEADIGISVLNKDSIPVESTGTVDLTENPVQHISRNREENGSFTCVFCNKIFSNKAEVQEHTQSHLQQLRKSSLFSCHECNFETEDTDVFTSHIKDIHQTHVTRGNTTVSDPVMDFFKENKEPSVYKFNKMLASNNLQEIKIPENGFCFISSLLVTLAERGIKTDYNNVTLNIMTELRSHAVNYMKWSVDEQNSGITDQKEQFFHKCADFFQAGDYTHDYVDVCIGACANALGINLLIFERHAKNVSMSPFICARGYSSPVYLYLQFSPSKKKNSNNLDAHYTCYVDKQYWKTNKAAIQSQMIVSGNVDLKSDRLLAAIVQTQINSRAEPTKSTDGRNDDQNPEERYVSYIFPLFHDLSKIHV